MKKILTLILFSFCILSYAQETDNRIHFEVDQLATYHGGYSKFSEYISENINCKIKIDRKEKNNVQLRFIVEKNGQIKVAEVLSDKPFVCSNEIVKALKSCVSWKPALKDKLPVRSIVQMDINLAK